MKSSHFRNGVDESDDFQVYYYPNNDNEKQTINSKVDFYEAVWEVAEPRLNRYHTIYIEKADGVAMGMMGSNITITFNLPDTLKSFYDPDSTEMVS